MTQRSGRRRKRWRPYLGRAGNASCRLFGAHVTVEHQNNGSGIWFAQMTERKEAWTKRLGEGIRPEGRPSTVWTQRRKMWTHELCVVETKSPSAGGRTERKQADRGDNKVPFWGGKRSCQNRWQLVKRIRLLVLPFPTPLQTDQPPPWTRTHTSSPSSHPDPITPAHTQVSHSTGAPLLRTTGQLGSGRAVIVPVCSVCTGVHISPTGYGNDCGTRGGIREHGDIKGATRSNGQF